MKKSKIRKIEEIETELERCEKLLEDPLIQFWKADYNILLEKIRTLEWVLLKR